MVDRKINFIYAISIEHQLRRVKNQPYILENSKKNIKIFYGCI